MMAVGVVVVVGAAYHTILFSITININIHSLTKPVPPSTDDDELSSCLVILNISPSIMVKARRERKSREKNETFFANLFSFQTSRGKVKPRLKSNCTETLKKLKLFSFGKEFQGDLKETKS